MLRYDEISRTLQWDEHLFELLNPEKPEYYEEVFPEGSVPKTVFNHRHVPMRPPADIWITDTTFRDGQQAMPPFSTKQMVDIYKTAPRAGRAERPDPRLGVLPLP